MVGFQLSFEIWSGWKQKRKEVRRNQRDLRWLPWGSPGPEVTVASISHRSLGPGHLKKLLCLFPASPAIIHVSSAQPQGTAPGDSWGWRDPRASAPRSRRAGKLLFHPISPPNGIIDFSTSVFTGVYLSCRCSLPRRNWISISTVPPGAARWGVGHSPGRGTPTPSLLPISEMTLQFSGGFRVQPSGSRKLLIYYVTIVSGADGDSHCWGRSHGQGWASLEEEDTSPAPFSHLSY